jgi:hypothetical protein
MKRHFAGLHSESKNGDAFLEGRFLVRVDQAVYRWHSQKPFFAVRFSILGPQEQKGQTISGRLYCTSKALWRLNWFLRDFGYDDELLLRDEVEEQALLGLTGVVQTSQRTLQGRSFLNLQAFAPAGEWETLAAATSGGGDSRENGHGF